VLFRILLIVPVALGLAACNPFESAVVSTCELLIKKRLLAPSMYRRVTARESQASITGEEYRTRIRDFGSRDPNYAKDGAHVSEAWVEYDSPNAYGTPVRGLGHCQYFAATEREPSDGVMELLMLLNGQTHINWLVSRLR
jgi:hypothetical protein